jgi:hypothetical protein
MLWNLRGFVRFLWGSNLRILSLLTSIPPKLLQDFHSTLLPLPNYQANHFFSPQEACRNKYSQDWIENYVRGKQKASIIWIGLLKKRRRKVKVDPKFGGQWKEKEKVFFYLFPFSPQATSLRPSFFIFWH